MSAGQPFGSFLLPPSPPPQPHAGASSLSSDLYIRTSQSQTCFYLTMCIQYCSLITVPLLPLLATTHACYSHTYLEDALPVLCHGRLVDYVGLDCSPLCLPPPVHSLPLVGVSFRSLSVQWLFPFLLLCGMSRPSASPCGPFRRPLLPSITHPGLPWPSRPSILIPGQGMAEHSLECVISIQTGAHLCCPLSCLPLLWTFRQWEGP